MKLALNLFDPNAAVNPNRKDKEKARALTRMLEEMVSTPLFQAPVSKSKHRLMTPNSLREALRDDGTATRITDIFRKFDRDGSGEVDKREFTAAVMATIPNASYNDVVDLFVEFDLDSSGKISYTEMKEVLNHAARTAAAKKERLQTRVKIPELPRLLKDRLPDLLEIEKKYNSVAKEGDSVKLAAVDLEGAVKMCFPRDKKESVDTMVKWLHEVTAARRVAADNREKQKDADLIADLDVDGDGKITLQELSALSGNLGFSKVQLRGTFRRKDLANAGYLDVDQMHDVLTELRKEAKNPLLRAASGYIAMKRAGRLSKSAAMPE